MAADLSILNPAPKRLDGPSLLHHLVARSNDQHQSAIEFLNADGNIERISYSELHRRSDRLASVLHRARRRISTGPGAKFIVPLFIGQCPDLYIAQIAVLKAGGAFCPISLDVPGERLRFILQDVDAKVLLTTTAFRKDLPGLEDLQVLMADTAVDDSERGQVDVDIQPSSPAYVMYTSGSTGQPKGVVLSHLSASQALLAHDRHIPSFSRFLQFASPTFDVSVFEIFFPFFRGRTLVCGERRRLLSDLAGFINQMEIDAAELTPSVTSSLLQGRSSVPKLRILLTIGEMLKHDVVAEFGGSLDQSAVLHGMYGPTEATIHCTLQPGFTKDMSVGNIGIPLDTVSAFVVKPVEVDGDATAPPDIVAVGEEGELAVGGYQLADGYLNRPEQTASAFVKHPQHGLLYRTGDRAKMTVAGKLECLGRISSGQVKLRGQRIELGEIEYAASKTPGCRSVVADVVSGTLVVFIIATAGRMETSAVLETCRKWLPAFMVPGDAMILESLPYLASGKVDRKALQSIYLQQVPADDPEDEGLAPRLRTIIDTLSTHFGQPVSASSQLGTIGLDSLSAIRIAAQLRKGGCDGLDATDLLDARTPREINEKLETVGQIEGEDSRPRDDAARQSDLHGAVWKDDRVLSLANHIDDIFAPTPVQVAMLSETARRSKAYCNWIELSVPAVFGVSAIKRSLCEVAQQHALLRSGFLALTNSPTTHAVIIWKELLPSQLSDVSTFKYDFTINEEAALLRPCSFQIRQSRQDSRILLSIHHALYDQWSVDLLRADIDAALHGRALETTNTFRDVSSHYEAFRNSARFEASTDFWQDQLRDFSSSPLPLMTGKRTAPSMQRTGWLPLSQTVADVRSTTKGIGCSAPAVYQAILAYLLGCYVGSTDVTYGTVFSGRHLPIPGIDRLFGPCLSTMPVRIEYGAARTAEDLLRLVHDRNRKVQKHSLLPLSKIKSGADLTPDTKLFDVLFVWQETSLSDSMQDCVVREVDSIDQYEFNLVLEIEPHQDSLRARATYQQSLINTEQVDVLLRQIDVLAGAILKDCQGLVKDLASSLSVEGLSLWNTNPTYCGTGHDLIRAIEHHAATSPANPALVFADCLDSGNERMSTLNYEDLNSRANRMAHHLQSLKKRAYELVCICMEKSVDLYIAILATLKAGCGYLPLLPDVPPARFASIMAQSDIRICLCDSGTAPRMAHSGSLNVLDVTRTDTFKQMPAHNVGTTISASDVAYTVYTSGSTGEPKGVAVTVANLLGNLQALAELYRVKPGDRLLQACSQAFDVSVFEIFFAFYSGICLCSASKYVLFTDLEASVRKLDITHLSLTPTVAALISPENVPSVKFLVTAGEAVTERVHEQWAGRGLHQGYGPSETTNICSINMSTQPDDVPGNIGPPLRNTSAMVLAPGPGFNVLPAGALGEFAFGGEQVFRGYVGMDDLNAEKIISHPRLGRVYKSGDIGRILHDGTLLISGRLDDQVKIRGNRVELGEINAILLRDPDACDCTTILTGEHAAEQDLVSFVVLRSARDIGSSNLKAIAIDSDHVERLFTQLEDAMPSYMIPSTIIALNKLPLTSQGKLDRRSLKALLNGLDKDIKSRSLRSLEPAAEDEVWSNTEQRIVSILASGLTIPPSSVSRNASFFGLGLNSLNAMSFAKHLTKALGVQVNPGVVLRNPTVSRLARHVDRRSPRDLNGHSSDATKLLPDDLVAEASSQFARSGESIEAVLPCTPLQEVMVSAAASSTSSYCNTTWLRVAGDLEKLKQCWIDMVKRHDILRTRFIETQSAAHPIVQIVVADTTLPLTEINGQSRDDRRNDADDDSLGGVNGLTPFKMEMHQSAQGINLALRMHHAVYDGISMARLLHEVESSYRGESLPPTPSFEEFLRKANEQNSPQAMDFWSTRLSGLRPSPLPSHAVKHHSQERTLQSNASIPQAQLDTFCRRHGITHLSLFQAALVKILSHTQAIEDICIGNVVSGRSVPIDGIDRLVAPCFNTIPVRARLDRLRSNLDLIKSLSQHNAEATDYNLSPLRRLQGFSQDPSKRLFDVLLLLQPSELELDESIWSLEEDVGSMGLPLVLEVCPSGDGFALTLHFLEETIPHDLASKLDQAFSAAIQSCLQYPFSDIAHFQGDVDIGIGGILAPIDSGQDANEHLEHSQDTSEEWSTEEDLVREVFARFANVSTERISKDTSMYQLGLDSLNAPQVAWHLRSQGYSVDAADVMERLTPRSIASSLKSACHEDEKMSVDLEGFDRQHRAKILQSLPMEARSLVKTRPCTSVQQGMLAQSLQSHGGLYVNHVTYQMPKATSITSLRSAWGAVAKKHELLRTGFFNLEDAECPFAMLVWATEACEAPLAVADDATGLSEIEQQAKEAIMEDITTPPWRITVSRTNSMTISMHHALYDAESLGILLCDLQLSLSSRPLGHPIDADSLLSATILSERRASQSSEAEAFWSSRLSEVGFAKFPDLSPTVVKDPHLAVTSLGCGLGLSDIERFCRTRNATIQAIGQTAWALLLAAYTGEKAVTFGTVFSGRGSSSAEQTLFPCVATVPVACNVEQQHPDIIASTVDYNAASQRHRSTPLADIQRLAGRPGRSIFDTVFVYQKHAVSKDAIEWPVLRETAAVDYAASLELELDEQSAFQIRLTFDTGRIPMQQAEIMVQQYNAFFENLVSDRSLAEGSMPKLFSSVTPREAEVPSDVRLLHQFVERGAGQHPNRIAFEFVSGFEGGSPVITTWTYKQLDNLTNQVAHAILEGGADPGSVVALCMEKCPEATFAFVGILKAGCSFLALDPDLPQDRVTFILEDSGSSALLTAGQASTLEASSGVPVINLSLKGLGRFPTTRPSVRIPSSDETCYVLYTSGTTGAPKGCEITHENAVQAMLAFQRLFSGHWTEESRWLQFASYWFDVSVLEQFWSWSVGISVVGAPRDIVLEDIPAFIRALSITHIDLTPSLARLVLPEEVPSLCGGVFITGGEALKQEIIDAWGVKRTICNGYGPTEATIGVTMNTFVGADAKPSNIGRPFDNVGAYVLGPDGEAPVLRGGVGELCVSGKLVGKGYLNRPDLTSKQFPYVEALSQRLYRTGDLVRLLHDDSFQFIGRQDSQAKLRGQRLEIAEIDAVIRHSTPEIADVVSMVVKSDQGKETLVSFITAGGSTSSREPALEVTDKSKEVVHKAQEACERKLPGYMTPTHIVPLTLLPLTVNNKVDAKRLSRLLESLESKTLQSLKQGERSARSLNSSERQICQVLTKLIPVEVEQTRSDSNLFSLGLSSISAISFASVLKQAGFERASVATIMKNQTIGGLAAALSDNGSHTDTADQDLEQSKLGLKAHAQKHLRAAGRTLGLQTKDIETVTPCTPLQQGLILESVKGESRPYFNHFEYELHDVNLERLEQAFHSLMNKVQVLRSSFIGLDEGHSQVILKKPNGPVSRWTSSSKSLDSAVQDKRDRWIASNTQELLTPFEVHIITLRDDDFLVLHVHHALYDAISYELLMRHLWSIYSGETSLALGPSFTDALSYGPLKRNTGAETFWKQRLDGYESSPLQPRYFASALDPVVQRPLRSSAQFEQARQRLGVSHQAIAQAAFEVALRKTAFSKHCRAYGLVVSGRSIELENADKVLGPMFNTLLQSVTASPAETLADSAQNCHRLNSDALPHQHTPLRDIQKWLGLQSSKALFDVLFVFQHLPDDGQSEASGLYVPIESSSRAEFPLACEIELHSDGQLHLSLLAQGGYCNQADLEELASNIDTILDAAISDPLVNIGETFGIVELESFRGISHTNGSIPQVNGVAHFEWTGEAHTIRETVAQLSGLNLEEVDEHSSIFSLGLDSIDAVKLASRLRNTGISIPVSEIIKAQTIPRMLDGIRKSSGATSQAKASKITELEKDLERTLGRSLSSFTDVERILPATPNQEALVADMVRSEFDEYLNHDVVHLHARTDVDRLKAAWQSVVDASPVLRTSFVQVDDPKLSIVFAQVVHSKATLDVTELHLEGLGQIDDYLNHVKTEVAATWNRSPALRLAIAHGNEEKYLVLSIAHALYDGHSLALLHEDVKSAYNGTFQGRPAYDEALEASLTAAGEESLQFWTDNLSESSPRPFPVALKNSTDNTHRVDIESELTSDTVRSFCQSQGISMQALAQTCWALTLAHYTGSLEVLFGVVLACRDSEEAEEIMFPTMNTVVMRSSLHGTRREMLSYMQAAIAEMLPHQRTPLRSIQKACSGIVQDGGLFDTLFIYQHRPDTQENHGEALYESVGGSSSVDYPVAVEMEATSSGIAIRAACKSNVLDAHGTEVLAKTVDKVLQSIIAHPDESTVDLKDGRASICALPLFDFRSTASTDKQQIDRALDDRAPLASSEDDSSPLVDEILEAFAQVSDVPACALDSTSTIESIGIDSISAIKVASLLRKKDIKISVSEIIRAKSAARMAEFVSEQGGRPVNTSADSRNIIEDAMESVDLAAVARSAGIDLADIEKVLPATAGQIYMLSMWKKTGGQIFYPTFTYRLRSNADAEHIKSAWTGVIKRHSILRTVFATCKDKGMPILQIVLRENLVLEATPLPSMASLDVRPAEEGFELHLTIHHAVYDALSLPLIMRDLESLVAGKSMSEQKLMQEDLLALSLTREARGQRKDFWTEYLQSITPIKLTQPSCDGPQSKVEIFNPGLFSHATQLEVVARAENLSIQALLFAAYAKVYASFPAKTGSIATDVVLGTYLSNRSHLPDLESLASPTLNLVPLLVRSPKHRSLIELAREIQADLQEIGTLERSATSLVEIDKWTGIKVDTFVNFLKIPESRGEDEDAVEGDARIEDMSVNRVRPRRELVEPERSAEFKVPQGLSDMDVAGAYQHSVDIEMTVADGNLDVGLFAPAEMIGLEEVDAALIDLKSLLDRAVSRGKERDNE